MLNCEYKNTTTATTHTIVTHMAAMSIFCIRYASRFFLTAGRLGERAGNAVLGQQIVHTQPVEVGDGLEHDDIG